MGPRPGPQGAYLATTFTGGVPLTDDNASVGLFLHLYRPSTDSGHVYGDWWPYPLISPLLYYAIWYSGQSKAWHLERQRGLFGVVGPVWPNEWLWAIMDELNLPARIIPYPHKCSHRRVGVVFLMEWKSCSFPVHCGGYTYAKQRTILQRWALASSLGYAGVPVVPGS